MRTIRLLVAALVIAVASAGCSDVTGPVQQGCPTIGGGGTCP